MAKSILDRFSIKRAHQRLTKLPFGDRVFSRLIGYFIPYTGTISPYVEKAEAGYACVKMRDRRGVRNHLNSIHAIALMNLAEVASGVALNYDLPAQTKAILKEIKMEYLKKARGTLRAEGRCEVPVTNARREYIATAEIFDASNTIVAKATATWLVGPVS